MASKRTCRLKGLSSNIKSLSSKLKWGLAVALCLAFIMKTLTICR